MRFRTGAAGHAASLVLAATMTLLAGSTMALVSSPARAQSAPVVRGLPDFTELVDLVGPSVANIRTLEKAGGDGAQDGPDEDMLEFFRRFGIPIPNMPRRRGQRPGNPQEQPRGVGSGFILTSDGYVMTNAHVIDGADEVMVTLTDKREFKAKIIGADKRSDVAVVKIDATGLPAVKIGDVSRLKVGEWVMAIGSPFGLENTVTAGIVSAKQRDTGEYLPFIQTDVAINPGNSGGPLINMRGEVVGINSQIYSRSGGFMGISFAIPIDEAMRVSDQLRATGRVSRGRIGVQIEPVTKDVADSMGLAKAQGALVRGVEVGSPAEKAGIQAGDVITHYDGKAVERVSDLPRMVGNTKPGAKATVTVFHRGSARELTVTVAEVKPDAEEAGAAADKQPGKDKASPQAQQWGLVVGELTSDQAKDLRVKGGVRVVSAEGVAARAGLKADDVIVAVGNSDVRSVKDFDAALAKADAKKPLSVMFRRGDWAQYTLIRPEK
ncbi:MAG: serine peptidase [Comamonas sp. SCN 67-35]|nr:Do family serine endopeptidase [Comamonas sp.]ODU36789.1 MAG: serine peptidase [Comamonas sp. SCN 67-35]OJW99241.1 MAG: serine peptidase [Burkholderiales bacterium 66-26]